MPADHNEVGSVSQRRYEQIVAELREVVERHSQEMFVIGDRALEIEPLREHGGSSGGERVATVRNSMIRLAEDIGLALSTLENARWTASRWPAEHRRPGESFRVHRVLARIEDEEQRFATIATPPEGKSHWSVDDASRRVGQSVMSPVSPEEKITAIHALARNDDVVAGPPSSCAAPRWQRRSAPRTRSGWWRS
nr:DUF6192 family protein [Streptomyces sp. MB09-01]